MKRVELTSRYTLLDGTEDVFNDWHGLILAMTRFQVHCKFLRARKRIR
jgi:hypothetical protein